MMYTPCPVVFCGRKMRSVYQKQCDSCDGFLVKFNCTKNKTTSFNALTLKLIQNLLGDAVEKLAVQEAGSRLD